MPTLGPALSTDDWVFLNPGDRVFVERANETPRYGTIDDVSEDATLIWVWLDGLGRVLVTENDDVTFSVDRLHSTKANAGMWNGSRRARE
jgi:hypothetical protein